MAKLDYPSIATASVSTALANGYLDGEKIPFSRLLEIVQDISSSVPLPLSVDVERGFAEKASVQLQENIHKLIEHGAIGINIEDSRPDHKSLNPIDEQCRKIEAIRDMSTRIGVPIIINARTDVFIIDQDDDALEEGIKEEELINSGG